MNHKYDEKLSFRLLCRRLRLLVAKKGGKFVSFNYFFSCYIVLSRAKQFCTIKFFACESPVEDFATIYNLISCCLHHDNDTIHSFVSLPTWGLGADRIILRAATLSGIKHRIYHPGCGCARAALSAQPFAPPSLRLLVYQHKTVFSSSRSTSDLRRCLMPCHPLNTLSFSWFIK